MAPLRRFSLLAAPLALSLLISVATAAAAEKPAVTIESPTLLNASAARYALGGHVNPKGEATEWSFSCSPACGSPAGGTLPADEASHAVAAQIEGLTPGTAYTITLHASNGGGEANAPISLQTPAPVGKPWWHLEASTRPTYINPTAGHPATGEPEIQEIIAGFIPEEEVGFPETAGFILFVKNGAEPPTNLGEFLTEPASSELGFGTALTAANVQAKLATVYGTGNVEVEEELVETGGEPTGLAFRVKTKPGVEPIEVTTLGLGPAPTVEVTQEGVEGEPEAPDGELYVIAENLGNADLEASTVPVLLKDVLPPGLEAVAVAANKPGLEADFQHRQPVPCEPVALNPTTLTCKFTGKLTSYDALEMRIAVNVTGAVTAPNALSLSGGNAAAATAQAPVTVSEAPVPFAVREFEMSLEGEGGVPASRAAAHPFQFTTQISLNQGRDIFPLSAEKPEVLAPGLGKDFHFNLPPGLIGNPSHLTRCTTAQFFTVVAALYNRCPESSVVGVASATVHEPALVGTVTLPEPIFNMEPNYGEPARFGFDVLIANSPVYIDTSIRSGISNGENDDYGITAEVNDITQTAAFLSSTATFWGVPGDSSHDTQRGYGCLLEARGFTGEHPPCHPSEEVHPPVLFTAPTRCAEPLATSVDYNEWGDRTLRRFDGLFSPAAGLGACNQIPFSPQIHSEPSSNAASSPTGLSFDIDVNDPGLENPAGLAQSQIKRAVVTLPQGFTTNPSVAAGLKACSQAEYEAATAAEGTGCSEESKVGEVEVQSPLIGANSEGITPKVSGGLYIAQQGLNPNHNLLTIYLIARSPELGVLVRQALKVKPDPVTGQLTTEVDDIPQLPFSKFHLEFRTGQRAPLVTPPTCGTYTVAADLYPYSEPNTPLHDTSSFQITQGPEGLPCPSGGVPPFHPNLLAGSENPTAGAYSPFYTEITRKDSEQEITRFSIKLPPGVIGKLAGVGSCSDAQIAAAKAREREDGGGEEEASPSCPASSQIGHSNVGAGVGNVLAYAPGKLYLAGPYHGSPISIVSITAAKVGPFDLGTVVVRFALKIDPETAEVSVDGVGSDPIPHIVDGIPVHLRDIQAFVDRPNFTLNPTSCKKKSTASTVLGSGLNFVSPADDVPVTISSPYQVGSCASLGFKPRLALSLSGGKTHRGGLPAFKAVLTYPKKGAYANIAKAQVTLPSSEILEQAHLEKVCPKSVFTTGSTPGENCPASSIYGTARAYTPLLDEPLEGPVYLRTGYGTVLPELTATLNNKQIHIVLAGKIDSVHKKGSEVSRIRNTFALVPDAPVSKFVLEMKGGKKGLLVNKTNICKGTHKAIAAFTAQNGKLAEFEPVVKAPACGKQKGKHGGGAHHR